jgi:hypothetical protein
VQRQVTVDAALEIACERRAYAAAVPGLLALDREQRLKDMDVVDVDAGLDHNERELYREASGHPALGTRA